MTVMQQAWPQADRHGTGAAVESLHLIHTLEAES